MQLSESSIYIGLKRLRRILYQAQFLMGKADRIVYGTPLMQECANVLRYYILAFDTKSRKTEYMDDKTGGTSDPQDIIADIAGCVIGLILMLVIFV